MGRAALVEDLAARLCAARRPHPLRAGVDGVDGAGKTTLADELAEAVVRRGRAAIRASADDFQRPRAERYRRGRLSSEGYLLDAFDDAALLALLLAPLGPGGSRRYRAASFDYRSDAPAAAPELLAPPDAILILDGVFLQRAAIRPQLDLAIFVDLPLELALERALRRDGALGDAQAVRERYELRYMPAQRRYLAERRPRDLADLVVDNRDLAAPRLSAARVAG